MKPSAKQITVLYFSIVAFAIIAIHASVFTSTAEDMELLYAENRLQKISEYVNVSFSDLTDSKTSSVKLQTQGKAEFDPLVDVYFDMDDLPKRFDIASKMPLGHAAEVEDATTGKTYFVIKQASPKSGETMLIALDNSFYELTEEQLLSTHIKQVIISITLMLVSFFVVLKISDRLTKPVTRLITDLSGRQPESLESIPIPKGTSTKEVYQLVESFNAFQSRISALVERERAFSRFASHELRTPLMVMQGAITLLGESNDEKFVAKQRERLDKAATEMNEFVQTLLGLTKTPSPEDMVERPVEENAIAEILDAHSYLLANKPVQCEIEYRYAPAINMPEAAFKILLGNLIKNAFSNTDKGIVRVIVDKNRIEVFDTGSGIQKKEDSKEGYGLGLLLVRDICRHFGYSFELSQNQEGGCTATIFLVDNL